jgi:hypothetical protein
MKPDRREVCSGIGPRAVYRGIKNGIDDIFKDSILMFCRNMVQLEEEISWKACFLWTWTNAGHIAVASSAESDCISRMMMALWTSRGFHDREQGSKVVKHKITRRRTHTSRLDHCLILPLRLRIYEYSITSETARSVHKTIKFQKRPAQLRIARRSSGATAVNIFLYLCTYSHNGHNSITTAHQW